ncbi:MAG TPA: zinc-ribbon domain-containing protein, partial [Hydrogenophaga sp.]|nr:zinc-ribbon domain-containing protein [Hydrogenophaga sp.]
MSYTTRCPACGTMFRVVPDQLKISDGWVRCGHCADVFDATLHLETWVPPASAADG